MIIRNEFMQAYDLIAAVYGFAAMMLLIYISVMVTIRRKRK